MADIELHDQMKTYLDDLFGKKMWSYLIYDDRQSFVNDGYLTAHVKLTTPYHANPTLHTDGRPVHIRLTDGFGIVKIRRDKNAQVINLEAMHQAARIKAIQKAAASAKQDQDGV